jgi:2,3-bisphosphoglycerate-independent phosphoglycerate mutase
MTKISRAVILAAGLGSRLRPITEEMPKCLTEIYGKPILWYSLQSLNKCGISEVIIVIGFSGQTIIDRFGSQFEGIKITYVWNDIYTKTNSMYSAWLVRSVLEKGALLIEGDVLFKESFIELALNTPEDRSYWLVSPFGPESEGSMSIADKTGRIVEIRIIRSRLDYYPDNFYKSTGVLKISPQYGLHFSRWLSEEVNNDNVNIYYDLVIAKHLDEIPLFVTCVEDNQWIEIDNVQDLKTAENRFQPRKYVIIILGGAADPGVEKLDDKTPLEVADIATIHTLTAKGKTGLLQTLYPGVPVDSIVANMGILGFYPPRYYPSGRASFEAIAQNILLEDDEIAFRCNLISLTEERRIKDFTAHHISTENALEIINYLTFDTEDIEIYSGQSYRNILVVKNAGCHAKDILAHPPHTNLGIPVEEILLRGDGIKASEVAEKLNSVMLDSMNQISTLNRTQKTSADMIWLWSPSSNPRMPSFEEKFGIRGAIVAGLDFIRGIGMAIGMETKEIHGATGLLDTNFKEKVKYAKNFLHYNDLVVIHINAPDEEAHARNCERKTEAIERIDHEIVLPIFEYLELHYKNNYRIAVLPDHYTCVNNGQHMSRAVPYCIFGAGIKPDSVNSFTEREVEKHHDTILKSIDFIQLLTSDSGEI